MWMPAPNVNRSAACRKRSSPSPAPRTASPSWPPGWHEPRHFTRLFTDEVGESPGAYVERIRIEAARRQLEETDDTVVAIAARCGFGTSESMRRNFVRRVGISPDQYRKTFA
ncbi:bacterial regulatory helix-turn-helix s, AraC family protein [Mycobacterium xenopi 3993]|nr:bacterial regulatory helix-turn-helix s, AraC family protein [Mycobacterium xenopi 3993]